jgi:hypothetical protein
MGNSQGKPVDLDGEGELRAFVSPMSLTRYQLLTAAVLFEQ